MRTYPGNPDVVVPGHRPSRIPFGVACKSGLTRQNNPNLSFEFALVVVCVYVQCENGFVYMCRLLSRHELASKFLAMGLVKLYGAVEATGCEFFCVRFV